MKKKNIPRYFPGGMFGSNNQSTLFKNIFSTNTSTTVDPLASGFVRIPDVPDPLDPTIVDEDPANATPPTAFNPLAPSVDISSFSWNPFGPDNEDKEYMKMSRRQQKRFDKSLLGKQGDFFNNLSYADWYSKKYPGVFNKNYKYPILNYALGLGSAVSDMYADRKKQKDWDKWFRQQNLPDNMYAVSPGDDRGDFDINEGIYRPNQLTPPNFGAGVAQYGGSMMNDTNEDMRKIKIRLRRNGETPQMAYGGQSQGMALGLDLGQKDVYRHMPKEKSEEVRSVIPQVPRSQANIEAEKGETVYGDLDGDGALEHMKIGGKRHVDGGTPLNVPHGSFIYSDTKKMTIKDPEVLKEFGMSPRKSGYTPAEIAKKYDINKYKAIMEDPYVDAIRKSTAQIMVKNFQKKLAKLALIQEQMKGFPQGIPEIVKQTFPEFAFDDRFINPEKQAEQESYEDEEVMEEGNDMLSEEEQGEEEENDMPAYVEPSEEEIPYEEEGQPTFAFGGILDDDLPYYAAGGPPPTTFSPIDAAAQLRQLKRKYPWFRPYTSVTNPRYARTSTGESPILNTSLPSQYADIDRWAQQYKIATGTDVPDMATFQKFIYEEVEKADPQRIQEMWTKFGPTLATSSRDVTNCADTRGGARTAFLASLPIPPPPTTLPPTTLPPTTLTSTTTTYYGSNKLEIPPSKKMPHRWFTPDVVNMGVAASLPPRKYLPYIAQAPYEPNRVSLEDWRAQAAARQSMYNKAAETMGVYGSTTGQAANLSNMAGQQAEGISGDISQVTSRNVDRLNQFLQNERQRKDQYNLLGANRATELYKGNVIANQQYDNARRQYLNNLAKTFGQGFGNAMYAGMINAVNPYFQLDTRSGKSYYTGRGLGVNNLSSATASSMFDPNDLKKATEIKNNLIAAGIGDAAADKAALDFLKSNSGMLNNSASSSAAMFPMLYNRSVSFNPFMSSSDDE